MKQIRGERLHVRLSANQVRKRLAGLGYGVRKVESAGRQEAIIIHTATGAHRRELLSLFQDVLAADVDAPPAEERRAESAGPARRESRLR